MTYTHKGLYMVSSESSGSNNRRSVRFRRNKINEHSRGRVKDHPLLLIYRKLDKKSLHILTYTNESFGRNLDLTSHFGYILFLSDVKNLVHITDFASLWSRLFVGFILGGGRSTLLWKVSMLHVCLKIIFSPFMCRIFRFRC